MKYLIVSCVLALSACDSKDLSKSGDATEISNNQAELAPFAKEFTTSATSAGAASDPVPAYLTGDFADRSKVRLGGLARCIQSVDATGGKAYVEIYKTIWDTLSGYQQRKVYFYLQGLCRYQMTEAGEGIMWGNVQGEGALLQDWPSLTEAFFSAAVTAGFVQ